VLAPARDRLAQSTLGVTIRPSRWGGADLQSPTRGKQEPPASHSVNVSWDRRILRDLCQTYACCQDSCASTKGD
jgi:hypothetical protein